MARGLATKRSIKNKQGAQSIRLKFNRGQGVNIFYRLRMLSQKVGCNAVPDKHRPCLGRDMATGTFIRVATL